MLDCPLKPESVGVVVEIADGGIRTVMITGDALLTAAEVARQVRIVPPGAEAYELAAAAGGGGWAWTALPPDAGPLVPFDPAAPGAR